ncbi:Panacea domain-containing protein [Rhodococcoides kroppenstedtii]|uniref:Panacea domain-containing protein n=1 Tax=Rhodococcoides kroppenstedtii TaxID=293050 RepID=UPI00364321F8
MASAHDVAKLILERKSSLEAYKLQKLVYYCQAWNLVATDEPLFTEPIKAWENGPVVGLLFNSHRGRRNLAPHDLPEGSSERLTSLEGALIDAVLDTYGDLTSDELVELTHRESPWADAWARSEVSDRINHHSMREYYARVSALPAHRRRPDQFVPHLPDARVTYVCPDDISAILSDDDDETPPASLLEAVRRARANLG